MCTYIYNQRIILLGLPASIHHVNLYGDSFVGCAPSSLNCLSRAAAAAAVLLQLELFTI